MEVDLKQALEHGTLSAPGKGTCTACVVITPFSVISINRECCSTDTLSVVYQGN